MAVRRPERRNSNSQLLQELDTLSQTMFQSNPTRRTASLALPRSADLTINVLPTVVENNPVAGGNVSLSDHPRPRSRRLSMSPFRTRPKSKLGVDDNEDDDGGRQPTLSGSAAAVLAAGGSEEKKGIWSWKPMRALSHIGMQRLGCLFSVEVIAIQGLPASMNGLRLSVAVRKKETKEGAVQTMPSRVLQGSADFEETLFIRCHVYCSGKPLKFQPRPFVISAVAIDAPELDFGKTPVDLSLLVKESMEKNLQGTRIRQWDAAFWLTGKAKGGELVVKLGFQIMEDGGLEIYKQGESTKSSKSGGSSSSSSLPARQQSKFSFSVASPKVSRPEPAMTPSKTTSSIDLRGIDDFNLDEPGPAPPPPSPPLTSEQQKQDDLDLPEFEVIDKGVELQEQGKEEEEATESAADEGSVSNEVVKEVVVDSAHSTRLTELDALAKQIKALESMVAGDEATDPSAKTEQEDGNQGLDADEETVTREFLQMLELEDGTELSLDMMPSLSTLMKPEAAEGDDGEARCFVSDLGKGLGSVVQTRDGGYLAALNPLNAEVARKETPKLAMQISKPIIVKDKQLGSGIEVFQKLAAMGSEELGLKLTSLAAMDELMGKTAEQIAFEGIASAIISGRKKEGASSSAAKSVAALKVLSSAMSDGRKERISTGLWNVKEEPVTVEEILALSLQKIESMAVEALKIQAEVVEEEPPFDVSPLAGRDNPLDHVISPEDWAKSRRNEPAVTMLVVLQLRDPLRRYETVGAPMVAVLQAARVDGEAGDDGGRYKVASLHVGGMKMRSGARRSGWDGEKQRLTAMQWLVAYGMGKAGKRSKNARAKGGPDLVWSISSRVMADMWLKPMRNPDVKITEK